MSRETNHDRLWAAIEAQKHASLRNHEDIKFLAESAAAEHEEMLDLLEGLLNGADKTTRETATKTLARYGRKNNGKRARP